MVGIPHEYADEDCYTDAVEEAMHAQRSDEAEKYVKLIARDRSCGTALFSFFQQV